MKYILKSILLFITLFCSQVSAIEEHFLLITGCSRSGTMYISKILNECGLNIGHEWTEKDGLSSWLFAVNTDAAPWGPQPNQIHFQHIFHQVRDPLKVISSVFTHEPLESWQYIIAHIPEISWEDSRLTKASKFWYYWNLKAEQKAEWTYRVEAIKEILPEFSQRLGIPLDPSALDRVPTNSNTRGSYYFAEEFKWSDLEAELSPELYANIRQLANRYGYTY